MLAKQSLNFDTILYRVKSGDSLNKIINNYYGKVSLQRRNEIIAIIQADNPKLKNPDMIKANQLLQIDIPPQYCAAPRSRKLTPLLNIDKAFLKPLQQQYQTASPKEKNFMRTLTPYILGSAGAATTMVDKTFQTNAPLVAKIAELYNQYKENKITKGQYDGRRNALLNKLKTKLGPVNYLLNGKSSPNEVIRISRTKGSAPTKNIRQQVSRMGRLSKIASRGGIVLSAAGLGLACYNIANTDNSNKKNEILVESLGALAGGAAYGIIAGVSLLLMATPVGWVAALVIGIGSVVAGAYAGNYAKNLYNTNFKKVNLSSSMGVTQWCKK